MTSVRLWMKRHIQVRNGQLTRVTRNALTKILRPYIARGYTGWIGVAESSFLSNLGPAQVFFGLSNL